MKDQFNFDMKTCPVCSSDVEYHFDLCWNCQYSFIDNKPLDTNDFVVQCDKCGNEVDAEETICPNCRSVMNGKEKQVPNGMTVVRELDCLRCGVRLKFEGNYKFHEGRRLGFWGDMFELFLNRESFDTYSCPKCGKIEFYLPGN